MPKNTAITNTSKSTKERKVLRVVQDEEILYIEHDDILFFEAAENRYLTLYTIHKRFKYKGFLKNVQKLDENFHLCHRSYVINANQVKSLNIQGQYALLINNDKVPCSRKGLKSLDDLITRLQIQTV